MDCLVALQKWFSLACDGDWEHSFGIKIETLDNPGWALKVDLFGTSLEDKPFSPVNVERSKSDWVICKVEDNSFNGYGGPENLLELIQMFTEWADVNRTG